MRIFNIEFQKQPIMRTVVYCLIPAFIGSIFFFGWVTVAILAISVVSCVITEWLFVRKSTGKVTEAVFVTAFLYAMTLPPTIPFYMVAVGAVFAITFGKMAFGGFGGNVFNPAIAGRAFVYITFPVQMTSVWVPAANFSDFPAGFAAWRFAAAGDYLSSITSATPAIAFKDGATSLPSYWQLFLGNINGQYEKLGETIFIGGGSLGEMSALLLMIGGIYLVYKKIANWRLVVGFFATFIVFQTILFLLLPGKISDPLLGLLAGSAILGGFYMVTDPVSAARTNIGRFIYAGLIAVMTIIIKYFSLFAGGLTFGILLGNMFGPIIDYAIKSFQSSKKAKKA
ncbi:RnfABCDGE type electron transport complex subunit D [candidate division KSB1 bacterium]|nr:RnfABCDGE type electron transport complex subunit D [candidate division KSB1 bacterium]